MTLRSLALNLCSLQKEEALQLWGQPERPEDINELFAGYCEGLTKALPWSEQAPAKETNTISDNLAHINRLGFLTINSQPAVDGADSGDPVHGWGPRNGYVYQKVQTSPTEFHDSSKRLCRPTSSSFARPKTSKESLDASRTTPSLLTTLSP